jgi:hypothetical protein
MDARLLMTDLAKDDNPNTARDSAPVTPVRGATDAIVVDMVDDGNDVAPLDDVVAVAFGGSVVRGPQQH